MKLTKSQLKQLIKEELEAVQEIENGAPETEPAASERSQAATVSRGANLAARERASVKVTDPIAAAELLFKQMQSFSDKLNKTTTMRNLIALVKQSS
tara:strand:+ start:575 stop:865 length:291 start_codon:yes stop_codon:yes gene_type:complete